jgi:hypothetical protein
MGKLTVDLKHKKLFVTMDKHNASHYRDVMQGDNHERIRPNLFGKFEEEFPIERDGSELYGHNFLGKAWCHKKGFKPDEIGHYDGEYDYPSLTEIFDGIKLEAANQIKETSGCPIGSGLLQEAIDNICATWDQVMDQVTLFDSNTGKPKN